MLIRLAQGVALLALTVAFHGFVLSATLSRIERHLDSARASFVAQSWLLVVIAAPAIRLKREEALKE